RVRRLQGRLGQGEPAVRPAQLHPVLGGGGARHAVAGWWGPGQAVDLGHLTVVLILLVTSPRVAPGQLTLQAWDALRGAARVLAPPDHPQHAALVAAGGGGAPPAQPAGHA